MTRRTASAVALVGYGGFLWLAFGRGTARFARQHGESGWRAPVSTADAIGEPLCVAGAALSLAGPAAGFFVKMAARGIASPAAAAPPHAP